MNEEETLSILERRTAGFLLFRRLFEAKLDRETADVVAAEGAVSAILTTDGSPTQALESVARTLSNPISDQTLAAIGDEYTRLFVGPGKLGAPFWESVYLDERELLFLESTSEVRHIYEQEGLQVHTENGREAEDALPFQLDFLATLSQRTADALGAHDTDELHRLINVQKEFETEHLMNWLPLFAERAKQAGGDFYPALCQAVTDYIAADEKVLSPIAE